MILSRVLVVEDGATLRGLIASMLAEDPQIEVVGTAEHGLDALEKIPILKPDALVLDIEMPVMDGLALLDALKERGWKLTVVVFSALTQRGATTTLQALSRGALDYVPKPSGGITVARRVVHDELIPRLKSFASCKPSRGDGATRPRATSTGSNGRPVDSGRAPTSPVDLLVIGASAGGPQALSQLLPRLPTNFPVPILVVQHMPPLFTKVFAERLDGTCDVVVKECTDAEHLAPGHVFIAPGDKHMVLRREGARPQLRLEQTPPEHGCRPAVDVLFRSAAKMFGRRVLAVVLTGMGRDGVAGCECVRNAGGQVLVQDEATSTVWGMPGQVAKAGLAHDEIPLDTLAEEIIARLQFPDHSGVRLVEGGHV